MVLTIDDCIRAVFDRDSGVPYTGVLEKYGISPAKFSRMVTRELGDYVNLLNGETRLLMTQIATDPLRRSELLNMGEEFIKQQYDRMMGKIPNEKQLTFYEGTFMHDDNINAAAYYALIFHNPELESGSRGEVIETIKNFPYNLGKYLKELKLGGLMCYALEDDKKSSPLAVLEIFDIMYQKKTGDKSLFDLNEEHHLHKWGDNFRAPRSYWNDAGNVEEVVYHALIENHRQLASTDRKKVIKAIKRLPSPLTGHLHSIELRGLMMRAFEKGKINSALAVMEVFDRVYQRETGDKSLFDLNEKYHLHKWGDDFRAPNSYWANTFNVEEAVYHTLTERRPTLASLDRSRVIRALKNLPRGLAVYLHRLGLSSLMQNAFDGKYYDSPLAVLKAFDGAYRRRTNDKSLFDRRKNGYMVFSEQKRLKVKLS